jgi:DNA adenine methylase
MARHIISLFPEDVERLVEPFAGSAAISLAAAYYAKCRVFLLNDANIPLMGLWESILSRPSEISDRYEEIWQAQFADEGNYYNGIRDQFNRTQRP